MQFRTCDLKLSGRDRYEKGKALGEKIAGGSIAAELCAIHVGGRLKFPTHSLRRGGVTTAVKRGASLKTVMATGG
jgi:hypothetical protein